MPDEMEKTDRQQAAEAEVEAFRQALGPFVVAAETTRMPMMFTDAATKGHPIIFVNQAFLNLTGYREHEVLGHDFAFLMERGADPEMLAEIRTAFEGGRDLEPLVRYRCRDGGTVWVSIYITPVHDELGRVVQHFASFVDVTPHKVEEDRLRARLDHLSGRTTATLSTILAIRDATIGGLTDEDLDALQKSILVVSDVQYLLESADDRVDLGKLVAQVLERSGVAGPHASRVGIYGDRIRVPSTTGIALAVLIQELARYATRQGALSNDTGSVDLSWHIEALGEMRQLKLQWEEKQGPRLTAGQPGYAIRLIEQGLAKELDADISLDYRPAGLLCELALPWDVPAS